MFHITWQDYLIFLGGALVVYYLYIALAYYRKDITALLRGGGSPGSPQSPPTTSTAPKKRIWQVHEEPAEDPPPEPEVPSQVTFAPGPFRDIPPRPIEFDDDESDERNEIPSEDFIEEYSEEDNVVTPEMEALQYVVNAVRDLFADTSDQPHAKKELLVSIKEVLQPYPHLNVQPYRIAIQNLISAEARERFGLSITERELETIWPDKTG